MLEWGGMDSEDAIRRRIDDLEAWLRAQGVDVREEQTHLDEGTRERLYWHYGYLIGLRDAMDALVKAKGLPLH